LTPDPPGEHNLTAHDEQGGVATVGSRALSTAVVLAAAALSPGPAASALAGTPPVGASSAEIDLRSVEGAKPHGRGYAIPLAAGRPAWYTEALAARVRASNGSPVAAPGDAPLPGEVGIRPGAWMVSPRWCTMNFVFGRAGSYSIGTAGHCTYRVGEPVVLLTLAPGSGNPVLVEIGRVQRRPGAGWVGRDFALVSIRRELQWWVSPTGAAVGGPCGRYFGSRPHAVLHYGHGMAVGTGGTPRAGLSLSWTRDSYQFAGSAFMGDSGAPVRIDAGQAAGNLTHLLLNASWLPTSLGGTRIGQMERIAGMRMASSSLCFAGDLNDGRSSGPAGLGIRSLAPSAWRP
jgi:hypothetical protein